MLTSKLPTFIPLWICLPIALGAPLAKGQTASFQKTARGIRMQVGSMDVEVAVATPSAFRLSLSSPGKPAVNTSTFLAPETTRDTTTWQVVQENSLVGVASAAGKLLIDPQTGRWTLEDARGETLVPATNLGNFDAAPSSDKPEVPGIVQPVTWKSGSPVQVYGCGDGSSTLEQTKARTRVGNGTSVVPYYWSPSGYAALAVSSDDNAPASWTADASAITWRFPGASADLYLMPASSLEAAARAYGALSGLAPVPPRWTFGYLQSRWGWKDRADIEATLSQFRTLQIPVDAFIFDFEWYALDPDYKMAAEGTPEFADFGWNPELFSQPAQQLANYRKQGVHFVGIRKPRLGNSESLKVLREKGWLLKTPAGKAEGMHLRDLDYANPDFRTWYAGELLPLLKAGVNGWWNDEGEATYTTFYDWNEAELAASAEAEPGQRFWSLNRAFSPGTQRLGATAWTGDVKTGWNQFRRTCTDLLNYGLAGMPFCGCDIGGFKPPPAENPTKPAANENQATPPSKDGEHPVPLAAKENSMQPPPGQLTPELFTRWMEAGVFFPIMRTHSTRTVTPHFPWLFGSEAQAAIKKAIELRYRLIPYYYSLAYETHDTGVPLMRPLAMDYPDDAKAADISDQWTMGAGVMVAPIVREGATARSVYLPSDRWTPFEGTAPQDGGQTINATAKLDEIPIYIRAGTIVPLGPIVQNTDELPGGPLDLQIYPGKDATFTLVEDDGESTDYLRGGFRKTTFTWNERTRQLSWTSEGTYAGAHLFKQMVISLFEPSGKKQLPAPFDSKGSIHLPSA